MHEDPARQTDALLARIDDLERRLARLEGAAAGPAAPTPSAALVASTPAVAPPPSPTPVLLSPPASPARGLTRPVAHPAPRYVTPAEPATRVAAPAKPPVSLEQLIGGKSFLVLGALIVVAGAGFFLKLAYDEGWIGQIPPAARCAIAGLFGAALIGAGVASERRLGRFAGVGFTSAGLGVLYATAFGAYALFQLVGPPAAFGMLCAVSALGLLLAMRARSLVMAVLALAGAYLAPVILARPDSPEWALPPYLVALLVVGSVLAVRDRLYRPLASVVWWATGVFGAAWVFGSGHDAPWLGMAFVGVVWSVVHAMRLRLPGADAHRDLWTAATTSFATTLWSFASAWHLAEALGWERVWIVPAAGASVTALLGMALAGMLDGFRDRPRTVGESIGASLLCQAGALVCVTVAVGIDTAWSQITVWLLLGVAAAAAGRWVRAASLAWYGAAVLLIGTVRVLTEALGPLADGVPGATGLVFTPWMALMGAAAVAWALAACLAGGTGASDTPPRHLVALRRIEGVLAGLLLAALVPHEHAAPEGMLLAYLVIGAAGLVLARALTRHAWPAPAACAYLALAGAMWLAAFVREDWYMNRPEAAPLAYPGLLWSLPLVAAWTWAGFAMARSPREPCRQARLYAWPGALLIGLIATTMETARIAGTLTADATLRDGSVSIWWAIVGTVLLATGFAARTPWLRYGGIGLLLAATGKLLTWDLSQVSPAVRVACFIAVGLVLLGVAAGYLRTARKQPAEQPE